MSKLAQLHKKQSDLEKLQAEVESLKKNKEVQKELAFVTDLNKLLTKYNKKIEDIAALAPARAAAPQRTRKRRKLKVYVNPQTGEKIETRGGNHRILKAWKAEFGADEVEGWLQS
ncbi:MAG: histone-like nucleoid-structuring protein, MvaT/MvaU family [Pseudomonadales bacterium]|jgi:hypothetical protein|nr:histone-like nucleoid-structuring protein, MvaT/MvaU family [Pseudomonadales bacterium]